MKMKKKKIKILGHKKMHYECLDLFVLVLIFINLERFNGLLYAFKNNPILIWLKVCSHWSSDFRVFQKKFPVPIYYMSVETGNLKAI